MGVIRDRMIEELELRGLSPATKKSYLSNCRGFVAHFMKSPEQLRSEDVTGIDLLGCPACGSRSMERRPLDDSSMCARPPDTS
jgi:hypothetical protein